MKKLYFISKSKTKAKEVAAILADTVEVEFRKEELPKIQSTKIKKLVKKKAKEAYKIVRRPVLVEHTSLCIEAFHDLKGLDTNYFSFVVGYENIVAYCEYKNDFRAYVESVFCLCDGKEYFIARAKDRGEIIRSSKSVEDINGGFGWDTIFVPNEDNQDRKTYEELKRMDPERQTMRRKALKKLKDGYAFQEKGTEWDTVYEEQEAHLDELAQQICDGKVMLFAGAGLSASLGFPTWDTLIGELGENVGYKKSLFKCHGNYMRQACYLRSCLLCNISAVFEGNAQENQEIRLFAVRESQKDNKEWVERGCCGNSVLLRNWQLGNGKRGSYRYLRYEKVIIKDDNVIYDKCVKMTKMSNVKSRRIFVTFRGGISQADGCCF